MSAFALYIARSGDSNANADRALFPVCRKCSGPGSFDADVDKEKNVAKSAILQCLIESADRERNIRTVRRTQREVAQIHLHVNVPDVGEPRVGSRGSIRSCDVALPRETIIPHNAIGL